MMLRIPPMLWLALFRDGDFFNDRRGWTRGALYTINSTFGTLLRRMGLTGFT
jgi:hypothetical protein